MGKNIENVCITEKLINKFQSQIMSNYGSFATSHCHQQNVHFTTFPVSSSFFFFNYHRKATYLVQFMLILQILFQIKWKLFWPLKNILKTVRVLPDPASY